jgi:hypothetical protein
MKKIFSLALSLLLMISLAFGGKVTIDKARQVGSNFFFERYTQHHQLNYQDLKVKESFTENFNGNAVYYIFNFSNNGYVIVSADDAVPPVLAYSFDGSFSRDNQPPQFINWMEGYAKQINQTIQHPGNPIYDFHSTWQRLSTNNPKNLDYSPLTDVLPLLISTWDQGGPYNLLCPVDPAGPGGHVWAGCVATAMSQVMYYYRWPLIGFGSHCYTPSGYPQQCADFGNTTYKWDEMVNSLTFIDSTMATLIWHAGVSVNMMYSPTGSGAYSEDAVTAMINNFRYSHHAHLVARDGLPTNQYNDTLRDNLDHKRVMYYDGYGTGGHAFNMDGYQGTDYFHFNWGWSGSFNGYFYLNNLDPGGDNFTNGQRAMVNLYPDTINNTYPSYCTGQDTLTALRGTFEDGSGPLENYQNNDNCSWLINPKTTSDSITRITLNFDRFNTESGNDVVNIYQGATTSDSLVASFSGNNIPPQVIVNSGKALITFTTDGTTRDPGWYISYSGNSYDWCTGTKVLTDPEGTITDGSGDFNYKNGTTCRWEIIPSSGEPVNLVFNSFKTESVNDFVLIYDLQTQQKLAQYSGDFSNSSLPASVTAPSGKMFIIFATNLSITDEGWSATWSTFPLGAQSQQEIQNCQVFPNPSSGQVFLQMYTASKTSLTAEFVSIDGKVQLSERFETIEGMNKKSFDISGLQTGVYVLRVIGDDGLITRKVVIN